jgi:ubiquinone/menaquinone biosynthesis C-methylase UbiE
MSRFAAPFLDPLRLRVGSRQRRLLLKKARQPGLEFRNSPYFDLAEPDMAAQWRNLIWPKIQHLDFACVLDLAAGHGRNSVKLREVADRIILVDMSQRNIDYCRQRFRGDDRFTFLKNDGISLAGVADGSVSLVYSFDSMVHFDSDVVREYLREIRRVLKQGGSGFLHHSNYTGDPAGDFTKAPGSRNFMSKDLFAHYCIKCGLKVVEQEIIDWNEPGLDCLSIIRKPVL